MSEVHKNPPEASAREVMVMLAQLNQVREALVFLHSHNIVKDDAVIKGCKKFISDHPQINAYLSRATGAAS